MTCHRCGAPIAQGQRFCNSCGAQQSQPAPVTPKFCVSCGRPLTPGSAFCNNCGAAVNAGNVRPQVSAVAPSGPTTAAPVPVTETPVPSSSAATTKVEVPAAQNGAAATHDISADMTQSVASVDSTSTAPIEPPAFQTVVIPTTTAPVATPQMAPPPINPVQTPVAYGNVPAPTSQVQTTKGGKGCLMAVVITLVVIAVIAIAVIAGMIYVAHKVKTKVQQFATEEAKQLHDSLALPNNTNRYVDMSDVPGSFRPGTLLAKDCPEASATAEAATAKIPIKEGLTWLNAWRRFNGDVEVMNKVESVTPTGIETSSSGMAFNNDKDVKGNQLGTTRKVCRVDLDNATRYYTENRAVLPHIIPNTTTFTMSRNLFDTLKRTGKVTIAYEQFIQVWDRMVPTPRTAELTRVEPEDVNYPVILNGQPTNLPVIHAHGHFHFTGDEKVKKVYTDPSVLEGDGDVFVLDDPVNPMMLQFGFGPVFQIRVTTISFPEDKPKPQIERQLEKQKKAVIYGIYFDFNEATIKKESQPVLKEIADAMKNNPDWVLTVNGYTDNIGGDRYNLELSQRRSAAVKKELVEHYGIAENRMTTGGAGAANPVDTNDTLEGRARNRRVELIRQ